jgi:hypothetical protein
MRWEKSLPKQFRAELANETPSEGGDGRMMGVESTARLPYAAARYQIGETKTKRTTDEILL